jgi:fumarate hydratase class I
MKERTMAEFEYQDPFPLAEDDTPYRRLTSDHVSVSQFDGEKVLNATPPFF